MRVACCVCKGDGSLTGSVGVLTSQTTERSSQTVSVQEDSRPPVLASRITRQKNFGPFFPNVLAASCLA